MTQLAYRLFLEFASLPNTQFTRLKHVPTKVTAVLGPNMDDVFSWNNGDAYLGLRRVSAYRVFVVAFDPKLPMSDVHRSAVPCNRALSQWVAVVFAELSRRFVNYHAQRGYPVTMDDHKASDEQKSRAADVWRQELMMCRRIGVERILSKTPGTNECSFRTLRKQLSSRGTMLSRRDLSVSDDA